MCRSEVEPKNFQRLAGKMLYHSLDDPTNQFEMAKVMSGMCKLAVGAMASLMRVIRCCTDRPRLSGRFKLDRPQQKLTVPVDADHGSDETTRTSMSCCHVHLVHWYIETHSACQAMVALSSDESEFRAWDMGCAAGMMVMSCLKGVQLEHLTLKGQTLDLLGLRRRGI